MIMTILRKVTVIFLAVSLCLTTVACGGGEQTNSTNRNVSQTSATTKLNDGQYQVQQATYDDASGEYTLFLLNSTPPTFATENLQMARLTDDEIKEGKKSYLKVDNGQPVLYLTEDFKIEYVHNVTENKTNPQTGQQETVVVRRENGFWAPFAGSVAGSIAGQAIGNALFRPQYYVPPVYQPGGVIRGFGGYGNSYDQAVSSYRSRYNAPPAAVRNRTAFRTTGTIRRSPSSTVRTAPRTTTNRPSGSGFGGSTLRPSGKSSTTRRSPSGSSFGSGRSPARRSTGFGSRRR
ncbi:hypothetical protein ACN23B_05720 [Anabaena sp. FACHB-709]|uniref:DUF1190 domain-containing protein n=2 Tax=Nostocaceae TaxID=1162 RepID=A0A1Z4KT18_ANAVA|nr:MULTISPECIES: hypothetical protein [Nostocaceae]BAY72119.1 hypothetical protein NIES23_49430 [Trichormus variabilis NIES-23]HBW28814.1 hypothetical protein [Nostoc sp. UBA8866]MBD2171444.1 hypothetical protein [Anabaena cylindrica FACHB-318]MBD2263228.1 hypothetical protein [Anabaena sp. FACHB-709]MBD2272773.1 hypothetical protein [Nostoc sp. PCC 7120 = FACHB-418]